MTRRHSVCVQRRYDFSDILNAYVVEFGNMQLTDTEDQLSEQFLH